jgi:predicted GH43/DUF377 family glycosyl hydrolase
MVVIKREGVLLEATDLEFENQSVLNPTIYQEDNTLHMFYRAVRKGNYSSIGHINLEGPLNIIEKKEEPIIFPEYDYEIHGVEDPRIVSLDGIFYLFYTAYDGKNARVAFATSKDLINWEKHGLVTPSISYEDAKNLFKQSHLKHKYFHFVSYIKDITAPDVLLWEKDCYLFPEKYNNNFVFMHRILPDIQLIDFKDFNQLKNLKYWEEYLKKLDQHVLMEPEFSYESHHIGGGAPLINTPLGWLLIYHAVEDANAGQIYHASAALLEKEPPFRVIGRLKKPLFSPKEDYEKMGDVWNVVFPTGTAIFKNRLYIYYGAADKRIAVVSLNLTALLKELIKSQSNFDVDIGFLAGEIFKKASRKEINLEQLKKKYADRLDLLLMAIGWLAREEKVIFRRENGKLKLWTGDIK